VTLADDPRRFVKAPGVCRSFAPVSLARDADRYFSCRIDSGANKA
jgi:hypothetical protein